MASRKSGKRGAKISANAFDEELAEYREACKKAGIQRSDTLRKLAKALVVHVEKHGRVSFPIRLEEPRSGK